MKLFLGLLTASFPRHSPHAVHLFILFVLEFLLPSFLLVLLGIFPKALFCWLPDISQTLTIARARVARFTPLRQALEIRLVHTNAAYDSLGQLEHVSALDDKG